MLELSAEVIKVFRPQKPSRGWQPRQVQSLSCKADKDFMLEALKLSTEALGCAGKTIKSDKDERRAGKRSGLCGG